MQPLTEDIRRSIIATYIICGKKAIESDYEVCISSMRTKSQVLTVNFGMDRCKDLLQERFNEEVLRCCQRHCEDEPVG